MAAKSFLRMVIWEVEEHLGFPMLELLIGSALIGFLCQYDIQLGATNTYEGLAIGTSTLFLFLTIGSAVVFARSFAGSLGRGEAKMLLSYPVKRGELFLAKFTVIFLVSAAVFGSVFSLCIYLYSLNPFDPMFLVSVFSLILQLMVVCGVTVAVSMLLKNDLSAILASVLLLLGVNSMAGSYYSAEGRFLYIFAYFSYTIHGTIPNIITLTSPPTILEVSTAIAVPIVVFVVLLAGSFVYFTRVMEVD